jgi:hypothetical protein
VSSPAVAIGHSGITTTITGGLTQQTGAISLTGNAASSIVNSSGAFTFSGFSGINLQRAGATVIDIGVTSTNNVTLAAGKSLSMAAGAGALSLGSGTGDSTLTTGAFSWTGANNKALTFTAQGASGTVSIFSGAGAIAIQSSSNDITITTVSNGAQLWLVSGTGRYVLNGDDGGTFKYSTSDRYLLRSASHVWTVGNGSGSTTVGYSFTGGAHTSLTASTERPLFTVDMAQSVQFATGALTTQRSFLIKAPTYRFVGASTLTNAATLAIDAAPTASTNATITNAYALWVQAGTARFDGAVSLGSTISGNGSGLTNVTAGLVTAGANTGLGGGTTSYLLAPGSGVAAATSQVPLIVAPVTMTYGALQCRVTAACGVGEQIVFTMQISTNNGSSYSDTGNVCTISGASAVKCTGTAVTTGAVDDLVAIKSVSSAGCTVFNAACTFMVYK